MMPENAEPFGFDQSDQEAAQASAAENEAESLALRARLSEKSGDANQPVSYTAVDGGNMLNETGQLRDRSTEETAAYTGL